MKRRNWEEHRFLSAGDDVNQTYVSFGRALDSHLHLLELNEVRCQESLQVTCISLSATQVHFVTAHNDWDLVVDLHYAGKPLRPEPLDVLKIVDVVAKYNHICSLNVNVCLSVCIPKRT